MPRLFVALDPPATHRDHLASIHDPELQVRWTRPEQHHLTLRFLGETPEVEQKVVAERLAAVDSAPFEVRAYAGLNAFPSRRRPRVLIVRLELTPGLRMLYAQIEEAVQEAGFEPERRDFAPHFTLGRVKGASAGTIRQYMQRHQDFQLEPFDATQFHLYESELRPDGARYTRLHTYDLAA